MENSLCPPCATVKEQHPEIFTVTPEYIINNDWVNGSVFKSLLHLEHEAGK